MGDKYMTVSGLPEPCIHHARSICHLALDMMEIAGQVQVDGESVQVSKQNRYNIGSRPLRETNLYSYSGDHYYVQRKAS